MPSLIITGGPCSGKTNFSELLASRALAHKSSLIKSTVIINERNARPDKTLRECYSNSTEEKLTRSALKSEFDKCVKDRSPSKLVILDSMNYIKGFRYELHCISKSAGQKHGVVWNLCHEKIAKAWNKQRSEESESSKEEYYYSQEMMDALLSRYEAPDQRNRWDRPLWRVDLNSTLEDDVLDKLDLLSTFTGDNSDGTGQAAEQALNRSVYNMHSLSDAIRDSSQSKVVTTSMGTKAGFRRKVRGTSTAKQTGEKDKEESGISVKSESGKDSIQTQTQTQIASKVQSTSVAAKREVVKLEDLIDNILDSFLLDVEPLKAGLSTKTHYSGENNVLHDVDSISQEIMNSLLTAQRTISTGGGGSVQVKIGSSGEICTIEMKRCVKIAEMKRFRRQYIKWISINVPSDTSQEGISKSFLSYVRNQL